MTAAAINVHSSVEKCARPIEKCLYDSRNVATSTVIGVIAIVKVVSSPLWLRIGVWHVVSVRFLVTVGEVRSVVIHR